jgi:hypothetical protein
MGLQIFLHSLRLVFSHFTVAFRISLPVIGAIVLSVGLAYFVSVTADGGVRVAVLLAFFVWFVALVAAGIWTAVAWHRYVLLDEGPGAVLPEMRGDRMLAYFLNSLLIGVVLIVPLTVAMVVVFALGGATQSIPVVIGLYLCAFLGLAVISYRLSPVLVGAAVGVRLTLGDAWTATRNASGEIVLLAIISVIASVVIDLPTYVLPANPLGGVLTMIWSAGTYWVKLMVGISIVTTMYGYYVEGRPLPKGGAKAV